MKPAEPHHDIRVLIADDRVIARLGTAALLESHEGVRVVGQANDGVAAINQYRALRPDVLLLDLRMPALDGIAVTQTLVREDAQARILILSHYDAEEDVLAALRAGARGYVTKDTEGDALVSAIRAVHEGRRHIPPALAERLAGGLSTETLSRREQQVLEHVAAGLTNKDIGAALGISRWTAALHVKNLLAKLGAKSRTEAVAIALNRGYLRRS